MRVVRLSVTTLIACLFSVLSAAAEERYFSVDDMLSLEGVGEVRFSPDGTFILFEKVRAYEEQENFAARLMLGKNNTEIFIAPARRPDRAKPLLSLDGAPNWFGAFSPTGAHVVVFWYEAGRIKTGVYTFKSRKLVEIEGNITSAYESLDRSPVWVSDTAIVFQSVSPDKQRQTTVTQQRHSEERRRLEEATWTGDAPGVIHLKTRSNEAPEDIDPGRLIYFDVKSKTRKVLAEGDFRSISASPESGNFAVVEYAGKLPTAYGEEADFDPTEYDKFALHLFNAGAPQTSNTICEGRCSLRSGVNLKWSDSGQKLAFIAYDDGPKYEDLTLYVYDARTNTRIAVTAPEIAAAPGVSGVRSLFGLTPNGVWLGDLLISRIERANAASPASAGEAGRSAEKTSYDWYAVSADGRTARNLTSALPHAPGDYLAVWDGKLLMSVGGDIVTVSQQGATQVLTEAVADDVEPFCIVFDEWRDVFKTSTCGVFQENAISRGPDQLVLANDKIVLGISRKNGGLGQTVASDISDKRFIVLDLRSGETRDLVSLSATEQILVVSPDGLSLVLNRQTDAGGELALVSGGEEGVLLHYNKHLKAVKGGTPIYMPFEREDGTVAHDWLLLPPGHKEGDRHPLIVKFYPGNERRGDRWSGDGDMSNPSIINEYVFASAGYAVLVAGMPAIDFADNETSEPMYEMHDPLIAAATRVVEAGYADPDAWFLIGYSYGGYGTLAVLTQTDKFRGGIAMAGPYNLTSNYGVFNRGGAAMMKTHFLSGTVSWSETSQGRMGAAPWEKPDRYVRNSPIFYIDQVEGAVLLIHGDSDAVDISGAEQVFTAMSRLNKDVEFIRLWGENHFISSAANIRYSYESMFRWLDRLDD